MRDEKLSGVKLLRQCNLWRKPGSTVCKNCLTLPVSGGEELGLTGKVNICKSLINAVIANKLKILISLNQKVLRTENVLQASHSADDTSFGEEMKPNPVLSNEWNREIPITSSRRSKELARVTDG